MIYALAWLLFSFVFALGAARLVRNGSEWPEPEPAEDDDDSDDEDDGCPCRGFCSRCTGTGFRGVF